VVLNGHFLRWFVLFLGFGLPHGRLKAQWKRPSVMAQVPSKYLCGTLVQEPVCGIGISATFQTIPAPSITFSTSGSKQSSFSSMALHSIEISSRSGPKDAFPRSTNGDFVQSKPNLSALFSPVIIGPQYVDVL
jgi:hypothetical protein